MVSEKVVGVVGLGYVGLPLALGFGSKLNTVGVDLSEEKVRLYREGIDPGKEMSREKFQKAKYLKFSQEPSDLNRCDFIVVSVPTPVDLANRPELSFLESSSRAVGKNMKRGTVVIFESTVYPGLTEEFCLPILEHESGLTCGKDFEVAYSPERMNPGDLAHSLERVVKVVAAQDSATLEKVAWLYGLVVEAGVFKAASIKVAEAAKVIENTQRDLNIALMNELSLIFHRMGIDTLDVLEAAGTKWNFLPFRPGLVGGHCIGVDPYYLTHRAESLGYHPQVILAGRRINDSMGFYVAEQTIKKLVTTDRDLKKSSVLVMGLTFKENCSDVRNSKVVDLVRELERFGPKVFVWDPLADPREAKIHYDIDLVDWKQQPKYDAVVAAVGHSQILALDFQELSKKCDPGTPFMDVKSLFDRSHLRQLGFDLWRL